MPPRRQTRKPRKSLKDTDTSPRSRYIPAAVRRTVSERDGRQCHYRTEQGRRCTERHALEHHHVYPFGFGGDHSPSHLRLLCRLCRARHNLHYAERRIMPTGVFHWALVRVADASDAA
jgi:5-methylcytosine-specific restriction endonuclease McrA